VQLPPKVPQVLIEKPPTRAARGYKPSVHTRTTQKLSSGFSADKAYDKFQDELKKQPKTDKKSLVTGVLTKGGKQLYHPIYQTMLQKPKNGTN